MTEENDEGLRVELAGRAHADLDRAVELLPETVELTKDDRGERRRPDHILDTTHAAEMVEIFPNGGCC